MGFYVLVVVFAVNIPVVDDFLFLFKVARMVDPATPWREVIHLLIEQHNDHRILLSRLIVLGLYGLEGQINFAHLIIVGSLSIAGIWFFWRKLFQREGLSFGALLPITVLLFQPSYLANVWWALSVLQHTVSLLGYCWLFWLALRPGKQAQVWALGLGALLLFSNSNGVVAWFTVVILLAIRRQWKKAALWAIAGVGLIGLYYGVGYEFKSSSSFQSIMHHPLWLVKSVLGFAGGAFHMQENAWAFIPANVLTTATGLAVLAIIAFGWWQALFNQRYRPSSGFLVLLGLSLVLLGTAGAAALTRSNGSLMVVDRYQVYSILCVVVAYSLVLMVIRTRQLYVVSAATFFSIWFAINSYLQYIPDLIIQRNEVLSEVPSLTLTGKSVISNLFMLDPFWQGWWKKGLDWGMYRLPDMPIAAIPAFSGATSPLQFTKDSVLDPSTGYMMVYLRHKQMPAPDFLFLRSATEWHLLPAKPPVERNHLQLLANGRWFKPGVESFFYPIMLAPGTYQIGWVGLNAGNPRFYWTNQTITRP